MKIEVKELVILHRGIEVERFVVLPTGPCTPAVQAAMEQGCSERTGLPREALTSYVTERKKESRPSR